MSTVTQQAFVEAVDDSRTLFTTQQAYALGTLQAFQGSLPLQPGDYLEATTLTVRFLDRSTTQPWQIGATDSTGYCEGHGLTDGTAVVVWSSDTDGLPSGLYREVLYYIVSATADTFALAVTAGGDPITFGATNTGTLSCAEPEAPLTIRGDLWYNADTTDTSDDPAGGTTVGFWTLSAYQAAYGLTGLTTTQIQDILLDADERVQAYVTSASYTTAIGGGAGNRVFRRAQGELAYLYLMRRPQIAPQIVSSSEKSYGSATPTKQYKQTYSSVSAQVALLSEEEILAQLYTYADSGAYPSHAAVQWGSELTVDLLTDSSAFTDVTYESIPRDLDL